MVRLAYGNGAWVELTLQKTGEGSGRATLSIPYSMYQQASRVTLSGAVNASYQVSSSGGFVRTHDFGGSGNVSVTVSAGNPVNKSGTETINLGSPSPPPSTPTPPPPPEPPPPQEIVPPTIALREDVDPAKGTDAITWRTGGSYRYPPAGAFWAIRWNGGEVLPATWLHPSEGTGQGGVSWQGMNEAIIHWYHLPYNTEFNVTYSWLFYDENGNPFYVGSDMLTFRTINHNANVPRTPELIQIKPTTATLRTVDPGVPGTSSPIVNSHLIAYYKDPETGEEKAISTSQSDGASVWGDAIISGLKPNTDYQFAVRTKNSRESTGGGDWVESARTATVRTPSAVFCKLGDTWYGSETWVHFGGSWRKAAIFINVNGQWKEPQG